MKSTWRVKTDSWRAKVATWRVLGALLEGTWRVDVKQSTSLVINVIGRFYDQPGGQRGKSN